MHKSTFTLISIAMLLLAIIACNMPGSTDDTVLPEGQPIPEEDLPGGEQPTSEPVEPTAEPAQEEEAAAPAAVSNDLFGFQQQVLDALSGQRDYETLKQYMSDPFEIMIFYGNGQQMPPDEAIEQLQIAYLPADNTFSYDLNADLTALLGEDPYEFYQGNMAGFVFSQGWGQDGTAQVILVFGQQPDSSYSWNGILVAYNGFEPPFEDSGLEDFREQLVNAWMPGTRDLDFVESVMAPEFWVAGTQAFLYGPVTPAEAIQKMTEDTTLSSTANAASVVYDLAAIREGINYDPLFAQGSDKTYIWVGQSGDGENNVVLVIGQASDGSYQLSSVLLVPVGYEPPASPGS